MSGGTAFKTVVFWLTLLLGTAILAPCLLLPAWVEQQAQAEYLKAEQVYLEALNERLHAAQMQIRHLNNDPAYIMRLAQEEFGRGLAAPNVETILIAPGPDDGQEHGQVSPEAGEPGESTDKLMPQLTTFVAAAVQRYPHFQVFVDPQTRPVLMTAAGVLLLAAIVLLGLVEEPGRAQR